MIWDPGEKRAVAGRVDEQSKSGKNTSGQSSHVMITDSAKPAARRCKPFYIDIGMVSGVILGSENRWLGLLFSRR